MRVQDVLRTKPTQSVVTVSPDATLGDVVSLLSSHRIGAVVVSRDGVSLDGLVSERDVVQRLATLGEGVSARGLPDAAAAVMTRDLHTCSPTDSVDELMQLMTTHRVRHVPVLQDGRLIGIVSIGDVVKHRIELLEFERDQLRTYVHS